MRRGPGPTKSLAEQRARSRPTASATNGAKGAVTPLSPPLPLPSSPNQLIFSPVRNSIIPRLAPPIRSRFFRPQASLREGAWASTKIFQIHRLFLPQFPHWLLSSLRGRNRPLQGLGLLLPVSFRHTGLQCSLLRAHFHLCRFFRPQLRRLHLMGLSCSPRLLMQLSQRFPVPFHPLGPFRALGQALVHSRFLPSPRPQAPTARLGAQRPSFQAAETSARRCRAPLPRPRSFRDSNPIRPAHSIMARPSLLPLPTARARLSPNARCFASSRSPPFAFQTFQATRTGGLARFPGWPSRGQISISLHLRLPTSPMAWTQDFSGALVRAAGRIPHPSTRTSQHASRGLTSIGPSDAWKGSRPPRRFAIHCWPS